MTIDNNDDDDEFQTFFLTLFFFYIETYQLGFLYKSSKKRNIKHFIVNNVLFLFFQFSYQKFTSFFSKDSTIFDSKF